MKIHFGFPNPDNINKLSPSLQAQNINLLKAEPGKVPLKGLHRIPQDGYSQYASNLPAFICATETSKPVPLSREGYPILTTASNMIPISMPPIYITFKGTKDIPPQISHITDVKSISVKDKNSKAYMIEYRTGLYGHLLSTEYERGVFPIANTVSAEDLGSLITIIRIISGFLRTHKYPAFPTSDEFEYEFEKSTDVKKRLLTTDDEYEVSSDGVPLKKMAMIQEDGHPTWVKPELEMTEATVRLVRAKPVESPLPAWGDASLIPATDGIVFPFIEDLAVWDKDTVCNTFGTHFTRCLGHTTDGCLNAYSELCQHWKRSLHRSPIGNILSHLCRVIDLAIPAQARVFPVIQNNRYTGCYLSGSGYSIALRGDLFRPTSFANNQTDFDCFDSTHAILLRILGLITANHKEEKNINKIIKMASHSMRGLNAYLKTWVITNTILDPIRALASRLRYPQEFWRINMTNIQSAISLLQDGTDPDESIPMHAYGLGRTSRLELVLSAFGPTAPSPNIPGSQRISVTPRPPPNFSKILAFRTTTLETAIADWKEFGEKGFVYNGPERLSARYQYTQVRGEAERSTWFAALNGYHTWFKQQSNSRLLGGVVELDKDEFDGGVLVGKDGTDLSGF